MPGRQRGHHGKTEHGHREIFGSAEGHGRPGQHWSDENQSQSTDDAADEGGYGSHVQSPAGFSAGREGGAFKHGRGGRHSPRRADENGGDAAAINGSHIHAEQRGKGFHGGHTEG